MNIVQITPGAGAMFCGNCFRDNALVTALRRKGHDALMVPLYLPLTLDEENQTVGVPVFYNGINVYLEQKSAWYRTAPSWVHNLFSSQALLKFASGKAAKTRAADLGDITLSMILGEEGNQARELEQLIQFLKSQSKPDIICLSNVLLGGLARRLRSQLDCPVACVLQGEDVFLDSLPETHRSRTWQALAERCRDIDLFISPSKYFAELMTRRLGLPPEKVKVVPDGINLAGYESGPPPQKPTIGFFARMCREKGLDTLVEAFILLKKSGRLPEMKLNIGGGCGPSDEPFVATLKKRLSAAGCMADVEFFPNVDRSGKQEFFRKLTVFSVPALYGESFGLYLLEALASGVPVVQPRHAAFPEIIEDTGGGVLCEPGSAGALADALEKMLKDEKSARAFGERGRQSVVERYSAAAMAEGTLQSFKETVR
jgi:glycosyltransferase involved in cell wall biosynthesis